MSGFPDLKPMGKPKWREPPPKPVTENGNIEDLKGHGCSDSMCEVYRPEGMHTNGGCKCYRGGPRSRQILLALRAYRREVQSLREALAQQKGKS